MRTPVRDGMGIERSIARVVGTAGSAVVFAVAVLLSLTLVPALTIVMGRHARRPTSTWKARPSVSHRVTSGRVTSPRPAS